jgi:hypothetical protein
MSSSDSHILYDGAILSNALHPILNHISSTPELNDTYNVSSEDDRRILICKMWHEEYDSDLLLTYDTNKIMTQFACVRFVTLEAKIAFILRWGE